MDVLMSKMTPLRWLAVTGPRRPYVMYLVASVRATGRSVQINSVVLSGLSASTVTSAVIAAVAHHHRTTLRGRPPGVAMHARPSSFRSWRVAGADDPATLHEVLRAPANGGAMRRLATRSLAATEFGCNRGCNA